MITKDFTLFHYFVLGVSTCFYKKSKFAIKKLDIHKMQNDFLICIKGTFKQNLNIDHFKHEMQYISAELLFSHETCITNQKEPLAIIVIQDLHDLVSQALNLRFTSCDELVICSNFYDDIRFWQIRIHEKHKYLNVRLRHYFYFKQRKRLIVHRGL